MFSYLAACALMGYCVDICLFAHNIVAVVVAAAVWPLGRIALLLYFSRLQFGLHNSQCVYAMKLLCVCSAIIYGARHQS